MVKWQAGPCASTPQSAAGDSLVSPQPRYQADAPGDVSVKSLAAASADDFGVLECLVPGILRLWSACPQTVGPSHVAPRRTGSTRVALGAASVRRCWRPESGHGDNAGGEHLPGGPSDPMAQAVFARWPIPVDGPPPADAIACSACAGVPARVEWRQYANVFLLSGWIGYQAAVPSTVTSLPSRC